MDPRAIYALFTQRREALRPAHARWTEIGDVYAGRKQLVTSELWGASEKPAVPNLTLVGINQSAMRVASTQPLPVFEPTRNSKQADQAARTKLNVTLGWWDANSKRHADRYRARYLIGYGMSPVLVRPDFERRIPGWLACSPFDVFPAPLMNPVDMCPENVIYTFDRTWSWLQAKYPGQHAQVYKGENYKPDAKCRLLEFWDGEQRALFVLGAARPDGGDAWTEWGQSRIEHLETVENRSEFCPLVLPSTISLTDDPFGQFDQNVGLYERQARLMAMEEIAIQRSIFVETYIESDGAHVPTFEPADGRTGKVGKVAGGRIREVRPDPGILAFQAVDRGERAMRIQGGVPAEFGGESPTNVRTGKRGDSVLSAVVDHPTQEYQELLAESAAHELRRAIAIDKAWFNAPKTVLFSWKNAKGAKTYTPRELWDTDDVQVRYSHPGADANGLVIGGGQRIGLGTLSTRGFMEIDPLVDDVEREMDRITVEALDKAVLSAIQEQAAQGALTLPDVARIKQLVRSDRMELEEAVAKVQAEAQERQAASVEPVEPGAPEAQPGIAQPGMGAEAGVAAPADSSLEGLLSQLGGQTRLAGALRLGQRAAPQEAAFNASAGAA